MGIKLVVEVLQHAPEDLTPAERMVLVAIGENVRDGDPKRAAWPELNAAELARRTGLKDEALKKSLQRLAKRGLEVRIPIAVGKDGRPLFAVPGRQCRYRFPKLEQATLPDTTVGGNEFPPTSEGGNEVPAAGNQFPPKGGTDSPQPGTGSRPTPTPSFPLPPPGAPDEPGPLAAEEEAAEGEQQQRDPAQAAVAFLEDLPHPWTVGPRTAVGLATLLLKMTTAQGWNLDADLVAELTKNPAGVRDHPRVIPRRIADLPKRASPAPASTAAPLPAWCGQCGDGSPAAKRQAHLRVVYDDRGNAHPCPTCHPAAICAA